MPSRSPRVPHKELDEFVAIIRRLRRDCPWDRKQTHKSLRAPLLEETYEVIEALERNDMDELRKELGDLMLHIGLQAAIGAERGEFTLRDVFREINAKLIRRHPHVFGTTQARNSEEVKANWEKIKLTEGRTSLLEGVPSGMPSLQRALRVQERAAKVGFDWKDRENVWVKVREEMEELRTALRSNNRRRREEEFGDLLFSLVNYARFVEVSPEDALHAAVQRFTERFMYIERAMKERGENLESASLERLDHFWDEAKKAARKKKRIPRRT